MSEPKILPIFYGIIAVAENGVIGHQGKIPWHLPLDFRWFKHKTMGGTLLMGRTTFESIGKPLPGRKTIVLSRQDKPIAGVELCADWHQLKAPKSGDEQSTIWVCGGAQVYREILPYCADLYLTRVKGNFSGDAFFEVPADYILKHTIYEDEKMRVELYLNRKSGWRRYSYIEDWPFEPN